MTKYTNPGSHRWAAALSPDISWVNAYAFIAEQARKCLSCSEPGVTISTTDLADLLWPLHKEADPRAERRLFKGLATLATRDLSDCCTRGEPIPSKIFPGVVAKPWRWHSPNGSAPMVLTGRKPSCPHCGAEL